MASTIVPVIMGIVADAVGIEESFFIVGAAVILIVALIALIVGRSPAFAAGSGADPAGR